MVTELGNYFGRIEDLRNQISKLVSDLPAQALNWCPIQGKEDHVTNSIAVLVYHTVGAEHFWIGEMVGGLPETRNRDAEFKKIVEGADEILRVIDKTSQETRGVFSRLLETDLNGSRVVKGRKVDVRWCLLHVVDHTSLHLGHMQLTYQLWSGGKYFPSPLWSDRLPANQDS